MDFIVGLRRTSRGVDNIWVIVDRLTKSAHFLPVHTTFSAERLARIYIREVVRLHGVPVSIILDRGSQFTSSFWRAFQEELGTRVHLSTAFHPQRDGQSERTIQVLVDMLRACVMDLEVSGTSSCLWRSLRTTTATTRVFRWPRLRPYMVGVVALQLVGLSLQSLGRVVQICFRRP